jgi:NAD+ diphosphatase
MSEALDRDNSTAGRAEPALAFTGAALDRAPSERREPAWLQTQRALPEAGALALSERGVWVDDGRLLLIEPTDESVFLGLDGERPLFASHAEPEQGHPAGLREAATELPAAEAALAAYAASLIAWHRRHRFCANCGAPTDSADGGHERVCPNCGAHHFPRTDPCVIVRVVDPQDRLLLGRQASWPEGRFSVLAGFVEPGETLEEAVRREVLEESGVTVGEPDYVASQPWPFPSSLMIGFHARANGGEPQPDDGELEQVRWFTRAEVQAAAAGQGEVFLSPPYSISRRLIDGWLAGR